MKHTIKEVCEKQITCIEVLEDHPLGHNLHDCEATYKELAWCVEYSFKDATRRFAIWIQECIDVDHLFYMDTGRNKK